MAKSKSRKHSLHRITFDGDTLDEVVLDGVVHIEGLNVHDYMIIIQASDGRFVHLQGKDLYIMESSGVDDLIETRPPLLGCRHAWTRASLNHECTLMPDHVGKHQCDCQDFGRRAESGEPLTARS